MSNADATSSSSTGQVPAALGTGLVYDPLYLKHDTGKGHPEQPARLDAVLKELRRLNLDRELTQIDEYDAEEADLLRCHEKMYLELVKRDIRRGSATLATGDTVLSGEASLKAASRAAGGAMAAIDQVVQRKLGNAFCAVRPPGHHATPGRGMGFCIYNNIAVAARYAQHKYKIGKVLIVDWDVHHGNGTQDVFDDDPSVFFFSTHQHPWYPHTGMANETGQGKGKGTVLNCPLPAGTGRKAIMAAFTDKLAPAMRSFKPELVLISAGFDSREDDPLGMFELTDEDFVDLTKLMLELADEHAEGRLVSMLEGGYNLDGLAKATGQHVKTLIEHYDKPAKAG